MIRRKKNVKKGIQFCLMVCGASGTGTIHTHCLSTFLPPAHLAFARLPPVQHCMIRAQLMISVSQQAAPRLSIRSVARTSCSTRTRMMLPMPTLKTALKSSPLPSVRDCYCRPSTYTLG